MRTRGNGVMPPNRLLLLLILGLLIFIAVHVSGRDDSPSPTSNATTSEAAP